LWRTGAVEALDELRARVRRAAGSALRAAIRSSSARRRVMAIWPGLPPDLPARRGPAAGCLPRSLRRWTRRRGKTASTMSRARNARRLHQPPQDHRRRDPSIRCRGELRADRRVIKHALALDLRFVSGSKKTSTSCSLGAQRPVYAVRLLRVKAAWSPPRARIGCAACSIRHTFATPSKRARVWRWLHGERSPWEW